MTSFCLALYSSEEDWRFCNVEHVANSPVGRQKLQAMPCSAVDRLIRNIPTPQRISSTLRKIWGEVSNSV